MGWARRIRRPALWVSHNLERIADRATNICGRVVLIAIGERITEGHVDVALQRAIDAEVGVADAG
jgi:phosphate uptake regulator